MTFFLLVSIPIPTLADQVDCYNSTLSQLLNKHAPLKSKIIRTRPHNPWYTQALNKLKLAKRHLQRIWSRLHSFEDLSWIKCYLLNRSFYVNIETSKSSVFQLLYGVPQGSVLGPILIILYTTFLSTVISNSGANHHLYML